MTDKRTFVLAHAQARIRAVHAVGDAPEGYVVTVAPPKRSLPQNAKFHVMCDEFDGVPWYGKARNADDWKTLFVSGHMVATGGTAEIIQGLENELVNLRESTAAMSKPRASSLIEYVASFQAQYEVAA